MNGDLFTLLCEISEELEDSFCENAEIEEQEYHMVGLCFKFMLKNKNNKTKWKRADGGAIWGFLFF